MFTMLYRYSDEIYSEQASSGSTHKAYKLMWKSSQFLYTYI